MEKIHTKIYKNNLLQIRPHSINNQFLLMNYSSNTNENESFERDLRFVNEANDKSDLFDIKGANYIPINSLSNKEIEENINTYKRKTTNEVLENGIKLEDQNINNYTEIKNKLIELKEKDLTNKNICSNTFINNKLFLNNKSQYEGYLYRYSDNEENNKNVNNKFKDNYKLKNNINSYKNYTINNNCTNNQNKKSINLDEKNDNESYNIQIDKELFEKIEYGIDENGNPFNIKNNNEIQNNTKNNKNDNLIKNKTNIVKRPIAFIIQQKEKGKNILIDINGKIIPKNEDGDYNYKYKNMRLLIKDFDVQRPELRIYGTRKSDSLILDNENDENNGNDVNDVNESMIKKLNISNNIKNKIFNRNISFNQLKTRSITLNNDSDKNQLPLNKNLLNFKKEFPVVLNNNLENIERKSFEKQYNVWKTKEIPNTDDRKYHFNNKKNNEVLFRKIKPKTLNNSKIELQKSEKIDLMKRTNNILNKNESGFYSNRSNINNSKFESYDASSKLNKTDYFKLFGIKKDFTQNINASQEINDLSSRIRLNKYKFLNKRGGVSYFNYNKNFNIFKNLIKADTEIKIDNNILSDNEDKNNNYIKISKIGNNFNIKNKKRAQLNMSAIDKITNSIKDIKNTIEKNIKRLKNKSIILNTSHLQQKKNTLPISTISINNSQNNLSNISNDFSSYFNYYSNNKDLSKINKNNSYNLKNKKKINTFSSLSNKQCTILNKEINNLISNYTSKFNNNNIKNEYINKKVGIYDYEDEIKNNEYNINSFLNNRKNKNKINYDYDNKLTQRNKYIIKPTNFIFNRNNNKSEILNIKNNESCELNGYQRLKNFNNRLYNKVITTTINKYDINNNNNNQIASKKKNLKINNSPYIKPKLHLKIMSTKKINNKSKSIGSFNELYNNDLKNKVIINK